MISGGMAVGDSEVNVTVIGVVINVSESDAVVLAGVLPLLFFDGDVVKSPTVSVTLSVPVAGDSEVNVTVIGVAVRPSESEGVVLVVLSRYFSVDFSLVVFLNVAGVVEPCFSVVFL